MVKFRANRLAIAALFLLGLIAYSNSFHNSFHYFDDIDSIINNPCIRNLGNLRGIWDYWPTRFVTFLSLALNYRLCGLDVFGYHVFNFFVHLACAIALWRLVLLTFDTPIMKKDTLKARAGAIAFFSAAVFLLHPLQTQPVNYIIQRATLLAAFFYITSVGLYARARIGICRNPASLSWKLYYAGSLLSAIMSLFSKEMAVSLPLAILLYEFFFFETKKGSGWKYAFAFPALILLLPLTVMSTGATNFIGMCNIGTARSGISVWHYLLTEARVIITYIRLAFMPVNQNFDYDYPVATSLVSVPVLSSLAIIIMILAWAMKISGRYRMMSFCIFWFFAALLPESGIVPIKDVIFEHRLYLSVGAFSVFLVICVFYLLRGRRFLVPVVTLSFLIVSYAFLTHDRNKAWRDELTLWNDTVNKSPLKARPYNNRGNAYGKEGLHKKALSDFNKSIELKPDYAEAYYNRAVAYFYMGDYDRSREDARKAQSLGYRVNPDFLDELQDASSGNTPQHALRIDIP